MLHKVNPPNSECLEQFAKIRAFQRRLLEFACTIPRTLPIQESDVDSAFGSAAPWLWRKLTVQRGEDGKFSKALVFLIQYVQSNPMQGDLILETFDHDALYDQHIDDTGFQFDYAKRLGDSARAAVKPLMIAMYESILSSGGFPPEICGGVCNFDRDTVVRNFWVANPEMRVCPSCDDNAPDSIGDKNYSDLDHFLPKSLYPFLGYVDTISVSKRERRRS